MPWNRGCEQHSPLRTANWGTQQRWRHIRFGPKGISTSICAHEPCTTAGRGAGHAQRFGDVGTRNRITAHLLTRIRPDPIPDINQPIPAFSRRGNADSAGLDGKCPRRSKRDFLSIQTICTKTICTKTRLTLESNPLIGIAPVSMGCCWLEKRQHTSPIFRCLCLLTITRLSLR